MEPGLFAAELEKFRPYQSRLAATIQVQANTVDEISNLWKHLNTAGKGREWIKQAETKERKRGDAIGRLLRAREGWLETREALRYDYSPFVIFQFLIQTPPIAKDFNSIAT